MSKLELLKFLQTYGEEVELGDFSPEELEDLRADFKYYVNFFKLAEALEGEGFGDLLD